MFVPYQESHEEPTERQRLYLEQLQEVCNSPEHLEVTAFADPGDALPEASADPRTTWTEVPRLPADDEGKGIHVSGEFTRLADQIAQTLIEAMTVTVNEVQRLIAGKVESAVAGVARVSEDIPEINGEITSLRRQTDSLVQSDGQLHSKMVLMEERLYEQEEAQQRIREELRKLSTSQQETRQQLETHAETISTLIDGIPQLQDSVNDTIGQQDRIEKRFTAEISEIHGRVDTLDQRLQTQTEATSDLNSVCMKVTEGQHSLESRLDTQAVVIRALHSTAADRGDRLANLLNTLQRLEEIVGSVASPQPLPKDL